MKVFYVMVLVLVAGAVPSHGRTESEGTLFNKTQPHESWNNVTVSSSKLVPYDYLYLVMQWPRSFCNDLNKAGRQCYQVPNRFTVHGLWPQLYRGRIDCTNRPYYSLFDGRQLGRALARSLDIYWPDLDIGWNQRFWGIEFNKHGSCTFPNQNDYFRLTVALVESLSPSLARFVLGITPGTRYQPTVIKEAVRQVTSNIPRLFCVDVWNSIQLLEIRLCAVRNGNALNLINCPSPPNGVPDCWNREVILPPA